MSKNADTLGIGDADLAPLSWYQVVTIVILPGFNFGSEIVLIIGIMYEMPPLAVVMLLFRLVHVVGTLFLVIALFGSKSTKGYLTQHENTIIKEAASWSELLHYGFAKGNVSITGIVLLLCACDISLMQMLPWKNTSFYEESKGFPSKSMMRFALSIDILQASVSALCSIIYIGSAVARGEKDATTSTQGQIFFGMNITANVIMVIMSFVFLYLREQLFSGTINMREGGSDERRKSVELELGHVYDIADSIPTCQNPMQDPKHLANGTTTYVSTEVEELKRENVHLENALRSMRESNDNLVTECEALQRRGDDAISQIRILQQSNAEVVSENQALQRNRDDVLLENRQLRNEVEELKKAYVGERRQ